MKVSKKPVAFADMTVQGASTGSSYQDAVDYIKKAIDLLSMLDNDDARDAVANLSVVYFSLQGEVK